MAHFDDGRRLFTLFHQKLTVEQFYDLRHGTLSHGVRTGKKLIRQIVEQLQEERKKQEEIERRRAEVEEKRCQV